MSMIRKRMEALANESDELIKNAIAFGIENAKISGLAKIDVEKTAKALELIKKLTALAQISREINISLMETIERIDEKTEKIMREQQNAYNEVTYRMAELADMVKDIKKDKKD